MYNGFMTALSLTSKTSVLHEWKGIFVKLLHLQLKKADLGCNIFTSPAFNR